MDGQSSHYQNHSRDLTKALRTLSLRPKHEDGDVTDSISELIDTRPRTLGVIKADRIRSKNLTLGDKTEFELMEAPLNSHINRGDVQNSKMSSGPIPYSNFKARGQQGNTHDKTQAKTVNYL